MDGIDRPEYVREMILSALKAGQEAGDDSGGLKLMNTTLKEMRFTAKIFAPYRHVARSRSSVRPRTARENRSTKWRNSSDGSWPRRATWSSPAAGAGIMQAAHEGAGPEHSFGVNIRLPFEQRPNPVIEGNPRLITYKYFFNRKVAFLKEADAVALFPGRLRHAG